MNTISDENTTSGAELNEDIVIRRAVKSDCASMAKLIKELAVYSNSIEEVTVGFDHFVESGFGNKPEYWSFVAEIDGEVIGFALYYIRYSTWKGQRLYLEDLLVTEDYRGRKIGKMLFDRLIQEGKDKKLNGMVWQVASENKSAIHFYEKYEGVHFDGGWINCSLDF